MNQLCQNDNNPVFKEAADRGLLLCETCSHSTACSTVNCKGAVADHLVWEEVFCAKCQDTKIRAENLAAAEAELEKQVLAQSNLMVELTNRRTVQISTYLVRGPKGATLVNISDETPRFHLADYSLPIGDGISIDQKADIARMIDTARRV